jgi:hypothetical protein
MAQSVVDLNLIAVDGQEQRQVTPGPVGADARILLTDPSWRLSV